MGNWCSCLEISLIFTFLSILLRCPVWEHTDHGTGQKSHKIHLWPKLCQLLSNNRYMDNRTCLLLDRTFKINGFDDRPLKMGLHLAFCVECLSVLYEEDWGQWIGLPCISAGWLPVAGCQHREGLGSHRWAHWGYVHCCAWLGLLLTQAVTSVCLVCMLEGSQLNPA